MQDIHIGPLPPPLGGISVFLYRLSKLNKDALFIDHYKLFKISKLFKVRWIKEIFNFKKSKNFIFHSASLRWKFILYFLSCITKNEFSLVIHGRSLIDQYNKSNKLIRVLIIKMLNKAKFIQVVNQDIADFIKKLKIKPKKLIIKSAFLPPPLEDELRISKTYPKKFIDFIKKRIPLVIANGSYIRFYKNIDLYGLDMCIELTNKLKKDFPNIGFIFALADTKYNFTYLKKMKLLIKKLNIENNFYLLTGQREIWPIFKKADLIVRPTNTDGDAVSIREALHFETAVIASDVTLRPEGCYLFMSRDLNDLYTKCKKILNTNLKK